MKIKLNRILVLVGAILFTTTLSAQEEDSTPALQEGPTMGWSSWNTFDLNISETTIKGQANAIVSKGLAAVGYNHINIDDGYFGGRDPETGQLLIHPTRFPNGLQPVVNYIHSKGLKAGIYSDGGYNTCGSFHGGDKDGEGVGLYQHDQQDCDFFFKELGFDFIKVDFCGGDPIHNKDGLDLNEQQRYTDIAKAIRNTGRTDVRMNICRWAYPGTWVNDAGFSWRTTGDISPSWSSVKGIIAENLYMSAYSSKGHFNDMDMLEVGVNKWGNELTAEETKTHFGLWCIMNSPLLIGCDMTKLSSTNLSLLKNRELIALNQDTLYQQAYLAAKVNDCYVLVKDIEQTNGNRRAFAIYNPNDEAKTVTLRFSDIDLADSVALRDVYSRRNLGKFLDTYEVSIPQHGARIYVAEAQKRLERTRYEAETGYSQAYSEIDWNICQYSESDICSGGYKAGYLGGSNSKNYLEWSNVYSKRGGEYTFTIAYISGENRSMTVSVNGKNVKTQSYNSGSWNKVATKKFNITLQPGNNVIRLSNTSSWMPDIDYIDVVSNEPADAISTIPVDSHAEKDAIHALNGTPLSSPTPGINIINRRKVLVK